jgi:ligand-binding SRPBCC domain-containing protein
MIYQLYRQQHLNMTIEEAWTFFSSPYHLNDITPDFFHVTITSKVWDSNGLVIRG